MSQTVLIIPYHFNYEKEEEARKLTDLLKKNTFISKFLSIGEEIEL